MNKSIVLLFILVILFHFSAGIAQAVNGEITEVNGVRVLRVWGDPYEMGFAQGYLLGEDIYDVFVSYVPTLLDPFVYNLLTSLFPNHYEIPEVYFNEAQGILDGALALLGDVSVPFLDRGLTVWDVIVLGSSADLEGLAGTGCSSVIAWGDATRTDPDLAGDAAVARNMDWAAMTGDATLLSRKTVVVARTPDIGRPTLSVSFPGLLGCLSCMNDAGVSVVQHQSYPNTDFADIDFSVKFIPINLAIRAGLEAEDYDGDGAATADDIAAAVETMPRSSGYNVIALDAEPDADDPVVIELKNDETARRTVAGDPEMPPETLAATNSYISLSPADECVRYDTIKEDALEFGGEFTLDRLWSVLADVEMDNVGYWEGWLSAQSMIFIPAQRKLALAWADENAFAPEKEPIWLGWSDVFGTDDDASDDTAEGDDTAAPAPSSDDDSDSSGCCG